MNTFHIEFFASLREQAGTPSQQITTASTDPREVYALLLEEHNFTLRQRDLKLAVNDEFSDWSCELTDGDRLVFIPPVSGG